MDSTEIAKQLKQHGGEVVDVVVNQSGRFVKLIQHTDGRTVAMLATDTADLATGRATVGEIIARNVGADPLIRGPNARRSPGSGSAVSGLTAVAVLGGVVLAVVLFKRSAPGWSRWRNSRRM